MQLLEQLAVASWSLQLYYYGWLPAHRARGRGGWESDCNDQSGGQVRDSSYYCPHPY